MATFPACQTINLHPLKITSFVGEPRHIAKISMSANAHRLMTLICSEYGSDGHIEFTLEHIGKFLNRSTRTAARVIKELVSKGLIESRSTGRSLMFFLTDTVYGRIKKTPEKPPETSPCESSGDGLRVDKNGNSDKTKLTSHTLYKKKESEKRTAQEPEFGSETGPSDENGNRKEKATPVFFSKKIDKNLGEFAENIKNSCDLIKKLPGKSNNIVNVEKMVHWCVKKRFHKKAIANAFKTMADINVWQGIGNPYGWLTNALKIASANYYEQEHIQASNDRKASEISFPGYLDRLLTRL